MPLPSVAAALNNSRARRHAFLKPFNIFYKPAIADVIFTDVGGATSTSVPKYNQWISCLNPNITHYGADILISNPGVGAMEWDVIETIYVSFRQRNGA